MTTPPQPPSAAIRPQTLTAHGQSRTDNYYWMRNREDPEVLTYLQAENAYTEQILAHTQELQAQLFEELKGRLKETDLSVPEERDGYLYYTRTQEGQQYPIYCRKPVALDASEEVLLDQNAEAIGHPFCKVGMFRVSPNQHWLAYSIDHNGSEQFNLYFKDLRTGQVLPESIPNTYYALEWANDNQTIFYNTLNSAMRPHQIHRHIVGTDPAQDVLIHDETDESYFVWLHRSNSQAFIFLTAHSTNTAEVRYLSTDTPLGTFAVFQARQLNIDYSLGHHGDQFYILTNAEALNFKLLTTPVNKPGKENWQELIPHRANAYLQSILLLEDYLIRFEREDGSQRIRVSRPDASAEYEVAFPESVYSYDVDPGTYQDYHGHTLRFEYHSLITPRSIIDYDLASQSWQMRKQQEIPSGYDPSLYEAQRLMAPARDGKSVPMSIVYKKGLQRNGQNPTLLYAYGSYGASVDPYFQANRLSLLDRGFIFAIAHIRGGSEMGRAWYEDGRMLHKRNTFNDFIDCAEYLIKENYTAPAHLAIQGGSAGGLLMGAVVNDRPDLFQAVIADVPFVDVLTTMGDPSIPLTVIEWEQWGNPANLDEFNYMATYSPYDQLAAKAYPNLLVTAGFNDPRVAYWEPAKWVARMRALKTNHNWLLLKTNLDAGHAGSSGRYDYLKEVAFRYAFILDRLGVAQ